MFNSYKYHIFDKKNEKYIQGWLNPKLVEIDHATNYGFMFPCKLCMLMYKIFMKGDYRAKKFIYLRSNLNAITTDQKQQHIEHNPAQRPRELNDVDDLPMSEI